MNGWRCPTCGGADSLLIRVTVWAHLTQTLDRTDEVDDNQWTLDVDDLKGEWDQSSQCQCHCTACGFNGIIKDCEWMSGPPGTFTPIAEKPIP